MAPPKSKMGTFFKRGLRALLPTVLTIWIFFIVYSFFSDNLVRPVNQGIATFLVKTSPGQTVLDAVFRIDVDNPDYAIPIGERGWKVGGRNIDYVKVREDFDAVYPGIIGIFVALLLVFVSGFVLATLVGRRVLGRFEGAMGRFPVVKIIYPYARQVVEFFMREKTVKFHSVVAVEYPRRGLYSIGFVTGHGMLQMNKTTKKELINVFVPSSPTPVTGYVLFVPIGELIPIPISVDEAIRFSISGGVLVPESQRNPEGILERFGQIEAPSIVDKEPEEESAGEPPQDEESPQAPSTSS